MSIAICQSMGYDSRTPFGHNTTPNHKSHEWRTAMKKLLGILLLLLFVIPVGCGDDDNDDPAPDPLASFRSFSYDLRDMVNDWVTELGHGQDEATENGTDDEIIDFVTALYDTWVQTYCRVNVYEKVINFNINTFSENVYTNSARDITIDVSNGLYVFEWDYYNTNLAQRVVVTYTYNPAMASWLVIARKGGDPLSTDPPPYLWLKQEGAVVGGSAYYISTIYHIVSDETTQSTRATNAIITYGETDITVNMVGEEVPCIEDLTDDVECIDETDTPIFTSGITADIDAWDDFKMHGITAMDYEVNP